MLVEPMTVAENIVLGAEPETQRLWICAKPRRKFARSDEFKLSVDPNATIETLSVGQQQRVELLKPFIAGAVIDSGRANCGADTTGS